ARTPVLLGHLDAHHAELEHCFHQVAVHTCLFVESLHVGPNALARETQHRGLKQLFFFGQDRDRVHALVIAQSSCVARCVSDVGGSPTACRSCSRTSSVALTH